MSDALDTAPSRWHPSPRHSRDVLVILAVGLAATLAILAAWRLPPFANGVERTDNAYVRGRTTIVAPQVAGYVSAVLVDDYQTVRKGQLLVRVDDATYQARVAQARASLAAQESALANNRQARAARGAAIAGQAAALSSAQAQLAKARADMARADDLVGDGSISVRERDQTLAALRAAEAQVRQADASGDIAQQDLRTVEVGREGLQAQVDAARAALRLAEIDLSHTQIVAPEDGQVGEIGVRNGQYVSPGTNLFALVPWDRWIIANVKEAQAGRIRVGQTATFTVDALDHTRFAGKVEQLSPAAGSEFAVLKPDNATGNFIKVPQRIGVRIAIDVGQSRANELRPGMSVEIGIDAGGSP